jgi:hypothetical protein
VLAAGAEMSHTDLIICRMPYLVSETSKYNTTAKVEGADVWIHEK